MVEKIKQSKDRVLERLAQAIDERGIDRMDVTEVGKLADVVKDLAEAEKSCWEAEYYMAVTDAMEDGSMGYDGMGYPQGGSQNGSQGGQRGGNRSGYRGQPRNSMGQYSSTRRGYRYGHDDMMQELRQMLDAADPQEQERIKRQLRQMSEM